MAGETKATIVAMEVEPNEQKGYTKITDEHGEMYTQQAKDYRDRCEEVRRKR
jgi:hypothetical protein